MTVNIHVSYVHPQISVWKPRLTRYTTAFHNFLSCDSEFLSPKRERSLGDGAMLVWSIAWSHKAMLVWSIAWSLLYSFFRTWQGNKSEISVFGFIVGATNYTATLQHSVITISGLFKVEVWRHVSTSSLYSVTVYEGHRIGFPQKGAWLWEPTLDDILPVWCIA